MAYWLFKSEPSTWSWQQQLDKDDEGEPWTGVRNHAAKKNMQLMKPGDQGFFYHSNQGKEIVGIVEVISGYLPDPTDESGKFGMVMVRSLSSLSRPVTLQEIKQIPDLAMMALVTQSRLSVQPVRDHEWEIICNLSEKADR